MGDKCSDFTKRREMINRNAEDNMVYLDQVSLNRMKPRYEKSGYSIPKWIQFCEAAISMGFRVGVYAAVTTVSKYIYLSRGGITKKVRFSNHRASYAMEDAGDCDYYIGRGNFGVITTEQLLEKIKDIGKEAV